MRANSTAVVVMGPTAVGKTKVAVEVAAVNNGVIISADSRQVYRGMDIGTGKDLEVYHKAGVAYRMIDIWPAGSKYDLWHYLNDAEQAIQEEEDAGKLPIICGGTGLYIQALIQNFELAGVPPDRELRDALQELDDMQLLQLYSQRADVEAPVPDTRARLIRAIERMAGKLPDKQRIMQRKRNYIIFCLALPREVLLARINRRIEERLRAGMIEEVEGLLSGGVPAEALKYYGLEYRIITEYLTGELDAGQMQTRLQTGIAQYAKRQMTWFRKMERDGLEIRWINCENGDPAAQIRSSLAQGG